MGRHSGKGTAGRWAAVLAVLPVLVLFTAPPAGAQSAGRSSFDHFTTSWPLYGAHRGVDCESCHVEGSFKGTLRDCAACHNRGGLVRASAPPLNHIRTTNQCQDCHSVARWTAVRRVDHTQVLGSCRSCHNGVVAPGKPEDHPPASTQCELCHRTNTWVLVGAVPGGGPARVAAGAPAHAAPPASAGPAAGR